MKTVHYSRNGYNGDYTYTSVCGKEVNTHQDNEGSTIHPEKTNCKECMQTNEYKTDWTDTYNTSSAIKRRIYIESDILQASEFRGAQSDVHHILKGQGLTHVDRVFSQVLDFAWHDLEKTWASVKNADEVYTVSSLMPLSGGSYMGAPVIFNSMCERAIKENVTGKSVIILNNLEKIDWYMIKIDIMKEAFKQNGLWMYNNEYNLVKIDVSKIEY